MRVCACGCGESLEGTHPKRRYASDAHRKRVDRGTVTPPADAPSTVWQDAVRDELARFDGVSAIDRVDVLETAKKLDAGDVSSAGYAALKKDLKASLAAIERAAAKANDPALAARSSLEKKRLHLVG